MLRQKPKIGQADAPAADTSRTRPEPGRGANFGQRPARMALLLVVLGLAVVLALTLRAEDLRTWWMNRQSLETLRAAAQRPDADARARFYYGRRLLDRNRREEALAAFQEAERALPSDANDALAEKILAHLGYSLAYFDRADAAAPILQRARKLNEDDPLVAVGLGLVFATRRQHDPAIIQFKLATALDPHFGEGWYRLGNSHIANREFEPAVEALKRSIALAPKNIASHLQLGAAYSGLRRFEAAIREYRIAHDLAPQNLEIKATLGEALALSARKQEEFREAAALLEEVAQKQTKAHRVLFALGQLYMRFNILPQARAYLQRSVDIRPKRLEGWHNLALVEGRLGHTEAAQKARALCAVVERGGGDARSSQESLRSACRSVAAAGSGSLVPPARQPAGRGGAV